jgi:hypothetical protein
MTACSLVPPSLEVGRNVSSKRWYPHTRLYGDITYRTQYECMLVLTDWLAPWSPQFLFNSGIFQHFMEPEVSLLCSQELSTGPYAEPLQFISYHPILSLRSILILSSHLYLGLPSGPFPSGFPTKILYAFLFPPCVLHVCAFSWNEITVGCLGPGSVACFLHVENLFILQVLYQGLISFGGLMKVNLN